MFGLWPLWHRLAVPGACRRRHRAASARLCLGWLCDCRDILYSWLCSAVFPSATPAPHCRRCVDAQQFAAPSVAALEPSVVAPAPSSWCGARSHKSYPSSKLRLHSGSLGLCRQSCFVPALTRWILLVGRIDVPANPAVRASRPNGAAAANRPDGVLAGAILDPVDSKR